MNIQNELEAKVGITNSIYLNNIEIDPLKIKAIMINEVVPSDVLQDFYILVLKKIHTLKNPRLFVS